MLRFALVNFRFQQALRDCDDIRDLTLRSILEDCSKRIGIKRPIRIVESAEVETPAVFGLGRIYLLIPKGQTDRYSPTEWQHLFTHELSHIKRCDIETNIWLNLVEAIHWYNPIVRWMGHRMRIERELACDAHALSNIPKTNSKQYGETILKVVDQIPETFPKTAHIGVLENKRHIKERIKMIARFHRQPSIPSLAIALCLGLGVVFLTEGEPSDKADSLDSIAPIPLTAQQDHPAPQFDSKGFYATTDQAWTWSHCPKGDQTFLGVPFRIDGIIRLASKEATRDSRHHRSDVTGIAVNKSYERLYLLHGTHYSSPEGSPVVTLRLNYTDGSKAELEILYGVHVRDWWRHKYEFPINLTDPESRIVWTGHDEQLAAYGKSLRLCLTSLQNPQPKKKIATIDLISANSYSSEVVFGISGGPANLPESWRSSPKILEPTPERAQSMTFTARDQSTDKPIKDLHLRIEGADLDSHFFVGHFFTNNDGDTVIEYPSAPLIYMTIWADADGYPPMIIQWDTRHHGPFPKTYNYTIAPGIEIGGTIKNGAGEPLAGAEIRLQGPRIQIDSGDKLHLAMTKAYTFSDENGEWSYAGIPDDLDQFHIGIRHPEYQATTASIDKQIDPSTFRIAPNVKESHRLTFSNLVKKRFAVQLRQSPGIAGTITDQNGAPIPSAKVSLGNGRPGRSTLSNDQGRFRIPNIHFPRNSVLVESVGFASVVETLPSLQPRAKRVIGSTTPHPETPATYQVAVTLEASRPFRAQVIDESGEAIPNVQITVQSWNNMRNVGWQTLTDQEGMFEWRSSPSDALVLKLAHPEYQNRAIEISEPQRKTETITLQSALIMTGRIVNAQTGQSLAHARLRTGYRSDNNEPITWDDRAQAIAIQGEYRIVFPRSPAFEQFLMVEAQGYKTATSKANRQGGLQREDIQMEVFHLP